MYGYSSLKLFGLWWISQSAMPRRVAPGGLAWRPRTSTFIPLSSAGLRQLVPEATGLDVFPREGVLDDEAVQHGPHDHTAGADPQGQRERAGRIHHHSGQQR